MALVVSDTSPVRALHHLNLLHVLGRLFDRVLIPPAVLQELTLPRIGFEVVDVNQYAFVEIRAPQNAAQVAQFRQVLDAGESEALCLAMEVGAEALLIDELSGRSVATSKGVSVIGTLGILSRVKNRGYVAQIGPLLDNLIDELDFFVSDKLREEFLRSVGE